VLRIRDPVLFDPGYGGKKSRAGSEIRIRGIPDHISESLETIFGLKILKFFDADSDPGSRSSLIRDGKIRICKLLTGILF
jgi:hypothetical protein